MPPKQEPPLQIVPLPQSAPSAMQVFVTEWQQFGGRHWPPQLGAASHWPDALLQINPVVR